MPDFYDPNATIDYSYDSEETQRELAREAAEKEAAEKQRQIDAQVAKQQPMEDKVESGEAAGPTIEPSQVEKDAVAAQPSYEGPFGALNKYMDQQTQQIQQDEAARAENYNTDTMGNRERVVAGGIDLAMDSLSTLIPALKPASDWWNEKSGRDAGNDPYGKAERDMGGMMLGTILTGGMLGTAASKIPGAANLGARAKFFGQAALDLGVDMGLSAMSANTREKGNMADFAEQLLPNGMTIPWASRDSDSPDVTFAKNMVDNMMLGTAGELVSASFALGGKNIFKAKNAKAAEQLAIKKDKETAELIATGGDPVLAAVIRNRKNKRAAQLAEGQRVLAADPDGVNGYNAFVNDPAEPVARITLDEEASPIDFMADQARIQNNVATFDGRARPLINDTDINALSRSDAATRAELLDRVDGELGAEFDLTVGDQKLTKRDVVESVNNLYDTALQPEESFTEAVKSMRNAEVNLLSLTDKVSDAGQRELLKQTANRLVDAVSPKKLRASAAIQTQIASSVSDIGRNIDLMADVVDTSRLQELAMPRLRTLLKEVETSKISQNMAGELKAKFAKKSESIEGLLEIDESYLDDMMQIYDDSVSQAGKRIDDFVDTLEQVAKKNPNYLRPLYRMWAKTNGEIDTLFKLNKYADHKLGIIKKAFVDGNPNIPSTILREMEGLRMANILNGFAPVKAWIGNTTSLLIKPATMFGGQVPKAIRGDLKGIQRAWYGFSGGIEVFKRARKMQMEEWRFANANPDAAMARGRSDYNQSSAANPMGNDWRKSLAEFEEFEEMSENWDIGKQMIWNATKGLAWWNRKSWNRWGIHMMYGADGFMKSMMASFNSRTRAYDELFQQNGGAFTKSEFRAIEQKLYDESFDENGLLRDGYAKFMSEEAALNADVAGVQAFAKLAEHLPALKSIFMFGKTRLNQFGVLKTFDPTGALGLWNDRSFKTIKARSVDEINEVLEMHGLQKGDLEGFEALKSEYIGRKLMAGGVVMATALGAFQGRIEGSGPLDPVENKKWRDLGGQPYTINIGSDEEPNIISYEQAPAWVKTFISLTADVTRAYAYDGGADLEDWYNAISGAIQANVTNDLFVTEIEQLGGILDFGQGTQRYLAGMIDTLQPGASVRSALSSILVPQLQDVENNFIQILANRNRWIPGIEAKLSDRIDIFTGEPVGLGSSPIEIALSKVLPGFATKAGREPWRQWLLTTGWTGLSNQQTNPVTGEDLTPPQREWINKWIGDKMKLDEKVMEIMESDIADDLEKYEVRSKGKKQKDFDRSKTAVHEVLDAMLTDAYKRAWEAYESYNAELAPMKPIKEARDKAIRRGNFDRAEELQQEVKTLREKIPN